MNSFIICFYATENTPYPEIANTHIIPSLKELDLEYDYSIVKNLGTWQYNTSYKPTFVKKMLENHSNRNIVLLDVDARVLRYPELFNLIPEEYNIAAHILDWDTWYQNGSHVKEFLSGTLFLRNNERTLNIVNRWEYTCKNSQLWEQKVLGRILEEEQEKIYELPLRYCYIDKVKGNIDPYVKCDDVVIKHYQASRYTKKDIRAS